MKMSLRASKPRMKNRSPKALPPSPVPERHAGRVQDRLLQAYVAFSSASTSLLSTVIVFGVFSERLGKFSRCLHMIDLVGRRRVRIGIAVGAQRAGVGKRHRRDLRRLRPARRATQGIAGADLIRRRFRGGRTRASDRSIDRHRRERSPAALRRPRTRPPPSGRRPPKPCGRNNCRMFRRPSSSPRSNATTSASLPCSLKYAPKTKFDLLMHPISDEQPMLVIERKKSGQCDYGAKLCLNLSRSKQF